MKHKMYFINDYGVKFTEEWATTKIRREIDYMLRAAVRKVPKYSVVSVNPGERHGMTPDGESWHLFGNSTTVIVRNSKTGKHSECTVGYAFGRYLAEPHENIATFLV